jgi:queuine tRNA-ribosyltransferase
MVFKIICRDKKTDARVGRLRTKSGNAETPFFMPVATKTAVKHISVEDLESMKAGVIISNAFILSLRPGTNVIKKFGGIGEFMNYNGINFTDSGGFQMYSKSLYIGSDDRGVKFRDPFAGKEYFITPEKDMKIQLDIGSDVAMCLDSMPLYEESKESIAEAVRKTTEWAKRCKKEHDKLQKSIPKEKRQLLFGITQGGIYPDLRKKSAEELLKIDFDGYSIGGLALPDDCYGGNKEEAKKKEYEAIKVHKSIIPEDKPVYLMGEGDPVELLEAISRGVDIFDSCFPTRNARRGTLFTIKGRLRLLRARHKFDKKPIDECCDCFVCRDYSRAHIRHLLMQEEGVGYRLASYHNLYFLQRLMDKAREEIKKGKFKEFLTSFKKKYKD